MKFFSCLLSIALATILYFSDAQAKNINKASNNIIEITMYGTQEQLETLLKAPEDKFMWKTYDENVVDSRNVALLYALACNRPKSAEILIKQGASWQDLGDMPYMEEECKKKLTSAKVRKAIINEEKHWAESDAGGDCGRSNHINDILEHHNNLEIILKYDKDMCNYVTRCDEPLYKYINKRRNSKDLQYIYRKYCRR